MKNKSNEKTNKYNIFVPILIGLLASVPLFFKGVDGAAHQDLAFHLSRIEGIAMGIKSGNIPVMMQSVWMEGKGYPVSIFYGDILLYFPALLRLIGIPVIISYKIYEFFINIATALVAYQCFKRMMKNESAVLISVLLYMTASYRYVDMYIRNAVGEYSAFLFFPIIALVLFNLLQKEYEKEDIFKNAFLLAIAMTGLIETHMLSTVMAIFCMVLVCLLYIKRVFKPIKLLTIIFAVGQTLLLNLYFIVPFLDYYINEPVYAGKGGDHSGPVLIRDSGAYFKQLFMFFARPFGVNHELLELRMQLTIGLPLFISLVVCLIVFIVFKRKYKYFVLGFMGILCLWMSTNLFPWNTLAGSMKLFRFLAQVQFPWRYLGPAIFFISLLFGMVLDEKDELILGKRFAKTMSGIVAFACLVMTIVFTRQYLKGYEMVDYKDYSEVDSNYIGACEYLKDNISLADLSYVPLNESFVKAELIKNENNTVAYYVINDETDRKLEVNKLNYTNYKASDKNGNSLPIEDGFNDLITVTIPANYEGTVTVAYKQPLYWIASEITSFIGLILLIVIYRKKNKE